MKYTVISNLSYNNKEYVRGDEVELPKSLGDHLEDDGVVSKAKVVIVKEKNWKTGPKSVKHSEKAELTSTGDVVERDEDTGEESPEKPILTEEKGKEQVEEVKEDEELDEDADENL